MAYATLACHLLDWKRNVKKDYRIEREISEGFPQKSSRMARMERRGFMDEPRSSFDVN